MEGLEHLRALFMGAKIQVAASQWPSIGVDTPADVARAVDWARSGWPPFVIYKPVFDAALAAGARLVAAHPTRDTLRVAMTEGVDGWPDTRKARLGLDRPLPGCCSCGGPAVAPCAMHTQPPTHRTHRTHPNNQKIYEKTAVG